MLFVNINLLALELEKARVSSFFEGISEGIRFSSNSVFGRLLAAIYFLYLSGNS